MCMLCALNSGFKMPKQGDDREALKKAALLLKEELTIYELESASRRTRGLPACPVTDARIETLKQEQYALAQRI